jgi:hypothetical protein
MIKEAVEVVLEEKEEIKILNNIALDKLINKIKTKKKRRRRMKMIKIRIIKRAIKRNNNKNK